MSKKRSNRNQSRQAGPRATQAQPSPVVSVQAATVQDEAPAGEAQLDAKTPEMSDEAPAATAETAGLASSAETPGAAQSPEPVPQVVAPVEPVAADTPSTASTRLPAEVAAPASAVSERDTRGDIRGVLIQVAGARLLLPNATIAEVLSYADPDPVGGDAPDWLLGRMRWRGWHLPLIAFGRLAGVAEEKAGLGNKVVVLKALAGNAKTPYIAMLTQGFPRLVTVARETLRLDEAADAQTLPRGIQARVFLNEDEALLPDLDALEALVADAVAQAA